jgi:hypothetical protein
MRTLLVTLLTLVAVSTIPTLAGDRKPKDWQRWAEFCGNVMVEANGIPDAMQLVRKQGCKDVTVVPTNFGTYVVYGVKVTGTTY